MIHLEIDGERHPIAGGETIIGSASDSGVVLSGAGVLPHHAIVQGVPPSIAIRPVDGAEVKVNGVRLSAEPTPLLHGDKIEIAGRELLVVDATRAGSTQLFDSGAFADLAPPPGIRGAATRSGGRLVCLTDGREYTVRSDRLSLGRDAGSDVVISGGDVSRHHAEIRSDPEGYILVDLSVNGTYVNGQRIGKTHLLARADVIRIGHDEFRFYADTAAPAPPPAPSPPPEPAAVETAPAPAPEAAPLASLLFRSGDLKGRRFPIKVPVINIGRGEYNDVVIADPSVSTLHAKLQRREDVWVLSDLGSTNGTFVEGERVAGEAPLSPGTTVKFGDVSAMFEPLDDHVPVARPQGTRVMEGLRSETAEPAAETPRPQRRRPVRMPPPRPTGPSPLMVVGLLFLLAILAFVLLS